MQGDWYDAMGVKVSNFVGPAYFCLLGGSGRTNFLNLQLDPFGVRPGGYFQYEKDGKTQQIQGAQVSGDRLKARAMMGPARRNARRDFRLEHRSGILASAVLKRP